jgi:hypothetical protein
VQGPFLKGPDICFGLLVIVAHGSTEMLLADERYSYDPAQSLLAWVELSVG